MTAKQQTSEETITTTTTTTAETMIEKEDVTVNRFELLSESSFLHDENKNKKLNILVSSLAHYGRCQSMVALCAELIRRGHTVTYGIDAIFVDNLRTLTVGEYASQIKVVSIPTGTTISQQTRENTVANLNKRGNSDMIGTVRALLDLFASDATDQAPYYLDLLLNKDGQTTTFPFDVIVGDLNASGLFMALAMAEEFHNIRFPVVMNHPILVQGDLATVKHVGGYYPVGNKENNLYDMSFGTRLVNVLGRRIKYLATTSILEHTFGTRMRDVLKLEFPYKKHSHPMLVGTAMGFEVPYDVPSHYFYTGPMIDHSVLSKEMALQEPLLVEWASDPNKCPKGVFFFSLGTSVSIDADELNSLGRAFVDAALQQAPSDLCFLWSLKDETRQLLQEDILKDIATMGSNKFRIEPFIPMRLFLKWAPVVGLVTQGGVASVSEPLYFGIPMVVVPFLFDQIDLAARVDATHSGINVGSARPHDPTQVKEAIANLLSPNNYPNYKSNAERVGYMFRSAGGIQRGADVVETTAHLGNGDHLVPLPYKDVGQHHWFVYADTDVVVVLTSLGWFVVYVLWKILRKMVGKITSTRFGGGGGRQQTVVEKAKNE